MFAGEFMFDRQYVLSWIMFLDNVLEVWLFSRNARAHSHPHKEFGVILLMHHYKMYR